MIKRLTIANDGIAPSGITSLRKPQDHFSLPPFFLCLHQHGRPEHGTSLRKMQFLKKRLSTRPPMNQKTFSKNINNCFGLLFKKQKHLLASMGEVPIPLCSVTEQGAVVRPSLSSGLRSISGKSEKGELTRISKQNRP